MKYKSQLQKFVFYKNGSDGTVKSDTAPEDTTKLWLDTSIEPNTLKYFDGQVWAKVNDQKNEIEQAKAEIKNYANFEINSSKQEINASINQTEGDLLRRITELTMELERIKFEVNSINSKTEFTKGEEIETWIVEEAPTLMNYPTFTDFFLWKYCSDTLYCSNTLICGTNDYESHVNEVARDKTNEKYYAFLKDGTNYYWKELTDEEYKEMSNFYSSVTVLKDKVRLENVFNENVGYAELSHEGLRASQIYCC